MAKVKSKRGSDGRLIFYWNPSKSMRDALEIRYYQSEDRLNVQSYIKNCQQKFGDYKRKIKTSEWIDGNSVAALIIAYKKTMKWSKLKPKSKENYNQLLESIIWEPIGTDSKPLADKLAASVDYKFVDLLYKHAENSVSEHYATHVCKVLRVVWSQAARMGLVKDNPFKGMSIKMLPCRTVMWTSEQVELAIKTADEMGRHGLGTMILLCYDLCQRPGDMRQLTWDNYDGNTLQSPHIDMEAASLKFVQEKTGVPIKVIVSDWLQERLNNTPRYNSSNRIVINNKSAKAYAARSRYCEHLKEVRIAAGLPNDLKMSDLRRSGATEMAEAECSNAQLRSVTGHQTMDVLSIYVRHTDKLAASGQAKRYAARAARMSHV